METFHTPDGFHLSQDDRDMMSLLDDTELRVRMIEAAIELAIREGNTVHSQMFGFSHGVMTMGRMPTEGGRRPTDDETATVMTLIGLLLSAFRRSFPHEHSLSLMPILDHNRNDQLELLAVIAQGENAKVLWKHARAAHDELGDQQQRTADILNGGPGAPSLEDVWADLDEECGYHGVNFDELDFDKLLGGGE